MTFCDFTPYRAAAESFAHSTTSTLRAVLQAEFKLIESNECTISWRVKNDAAIIRKLSDSRRSAAQGRGTVNDLIGIRVLCPHLGLLGRIITAIDRWSVDTSLRQVRGQNTIEDPSAGGYRAIHLDFIFTDDNCWGFPSFITVELQLTTWLQLLHTEISHRYFYKALDPPDPALQTLLENFSVAIHQLDRAFADRELPRLKALIDDDSL
jgi:ppGpp synthetase/RelA/SpoT-type nucleotidyltranferase